jgi:2-iminobutanoate/2-iminopropanoate deaminase
MRILLTGWLLFASTAFQAQIRAVVPAPNSAAHPTYSRGVDAGDYVYVSAQGPRRPDGSLPPTFEAQVRQALDNVKSVVVGAGLSMGHVVYTQVYLEDIRNYPEVNRVFAEVFTQAPPARAVLGVAKLPEPSVQINAVAVRNLAERRAIVPAAYKADESASPGILTHDRLFVSAMAGSDPVTGKVPDDPAAQVDFALDRMKAVLESAGLDLRHTSLPGGTHIEYTGVAVRDLKQRQAVRPKNMPPSPTASPCVFAGATLYCSAKSGFIPGPHGGVYASTTAHQLRQTMRNLLDNLEEAGMNFDQVVTTNVYLDDLSDAQAFDEVYVQYFGQVLPARTTIEQIAPADRTPDKEDHYPDFEQVSLVAIRSPAGQ